MGLLNVQKTARRSFSTYCTGNRLLYLLALDATESRQAFVAPRQGALFRRCYNSVPLNPSHENPS